MLTVDVNILVAGYRSESPAYRVIRDWLQNELLGTNDVFTVFDIAMSGFIRIVTNPRIYKTPTPIADALEYASAIRTAPGFTPTRAGDRHWDIFADFCIRTNARGNLVPDAYLAALAVEADCTWVTMDADFRKFPGLKLKLLKP